MSWDQVGVRDGVVAVGVAATVVAAGLSDRHPGTGLDLLGYGLLAASGLALVARRRAPVTVLAVTGLSALGYQAVGFDVPVIAFLFAVYSAVRAGHRGVTVAAAVVMVVALPLAILAAPADWRLGEALRQARDALELAWLVAAAAAGEALRQAERRADEAERTREETARRRADEERLHIARELHDSLTHQISVIKVQAEVAVHLARKRDEPVPEALLAIREAGREATRELRATLEVLRSDDHHLPVGLADVPELVRRTRSSGLEATLTIEGDRGELPLAVDRTGYRIVQESLTNIVRHAAATTAWVRIAYRPDVVVIQVDDDGVGGGSDRPPVAGIGLLGMRERVVALGGELRAEPGRDGGFTVQAELPVGRTR